MATKQNTSSKSPSFGEVIDRIFDIQAVALAAAALSGSEIGEGCASERAMLLVGDMLGQLANQVEAAKGGAA